MQATVYCRGLNNYLYYFGGFLIIIIVDKVYCRGLNSYLYYLGGFLILIIVFDGPQNPVLIIKAPIL